MKKVTQIWMAAVLTVCSAAALTACDGIADPTRVVTLADTSAVEKSGSFDLNSQSGNTSDAGQSQSDASQVSRSQSGDPITVKEFFNDYNGMDVMSEYGEKLAGDEYDVDVYLGKDDQIIYELNLRTQYDSSKLEEAKNTLKSTVKEKRNAIAKDLSQYCTDYNLKPFSVVLRFRNSDGTQIYEFEINSSEA